MNKDNRFTSECVYTILHSDRLATMHKSLKGQFTEGKAWIGAKRLVENAKRDGLCVPIFFAKAEKTDELVYWGVISAVKISSRGKDHSKSVINVVEIRSFKKPRPRKTDLVVASSGKRIPLDHIRPYVLCRTPRFLARDRGATAATKRGAKPQSTPKTVVELEALGREALDTAHGFYCEGDHCPFALFAGIDGNQHLVRLPAASGTIDADHIDACRNLITELAERNPHALVFDGYVTGGPSKQDAIVCEVADARKKTVIRLVQRYRQQAGARGIARIGRVIVFKRSASKSTTQL